MSSELENLQKKVSIRPSIFINVEDYGIKMVHLDRINTNELSFSNYIEQIPLSISKKIREARIMWWRC